MAFPRVGDTAPEFDAPGTGGKTYSLSDYKGKPVVLVFYPGDATPVCTEQLNSYSESFGDFENVGATVFALSPQDIDSHDAFHAQHGFAFPLLYDEGKEIGEAYGVVGPLGFYRRSVVVIDGDGVVRFIKRSTAGLGYVNTADIIDAVSEAESEHAS